MSDLIKGGVSKCVCLLSLTFMNLYINYFDLHVVRYGGLMRNFVLNRYVLPMYNQKYLVGH